MLASDRGSVMRRQRRCSRSKNAKLRNRRQQDAERSHRGRNEKSCTCCALIRLQLYRKEESGKWNRTSGHSQPSLLTMKVLVTLSTLELSLIN
eukprot:scaffold1637_cov118-Skeletonema_dohrnii-CCMP3373.AAC.8